MKTIAASMSRLVALLGMSGLMAFLGLAGTASAEEAAAPATVSPTISAPAPLQDAVKNWHTSFEGRQYTDVKAQSDEIKRVTPSYQARVVTNTKMLDNKFLTQLTFKAVKKEGTTNVTPGAHLWENYYSIIDHKYGEITPYTHFWLPTAGKGTNNWTGLYFAPKLPVQTSIGEFAFAFSVDNWMVLTSRSDMTTIEKPDPSKVFFSLQGENNDQIVKRDPSYATEISPEISFTPSYFSKKLNLFAKVYYHRDYDPRYKLIETPTEVRQEKSGYNITNSTVNRVIITYNLTDKVSLINDFWHFQEGLYEARRNVANGSRITNIGIVSYKLF